MHRTKLENLVISTEYKAKISIKLLPPMLENLVISTEYKAFALVFCRQAMLENLVISTEYKALRADVEQILSLRTL